MRREEVRTQPQSAKAALGDNYRKLLRSLTWGMRRNPDGWSKKQFNAAAIGFRTAANLIAIAYLPMSKLKYLPSNPLTPAASSKYGALIHLCL